MVGIVDSAGWRQVFGRQHERQSRTLGSCSSRADSVPAFGNALCRRPIRESYGSCSPGVVEQLPGVGPILIPPDGVRGPG